MKTETHFKTEENGVCRIRALEHSDIDAAVALCNKCVGENMYSSEELASAIGSKDSFFYLLTSYDGRLIGYIYFYLTNIVTLTDAVKIDQKALDDIGDIKNAVIGRIQSVGVDNEYRGKGLAVPMMEFALEKLKSVGADTVFIVCWKMGDSIPLAKTVDRANFHYLCEVEKPWHDHPELFCEFCGGRCHCDAVVYYKHFRGVKK